MSRKETFRKLEESLKEAREKGVTHMAFYSSPDGKNFTTSMNCGNDDLYDYLYSLLVRDEVIFEIVYSIVEDIMRKRIPIIDEKDKAN